MSRNMASQLLGREFRGGSPSSARDAKYRSELLMKPVNELPYSTESMLRWREVAH